MANSTGTDKFRAFSRVVGRQAGQSRWTRATYHAGKGFLETARRVLSALFHQVTGLFFLIFGFVLAFAAVREYRAYANGSIGPGRAILAGVLALMFLYFAFSGFKRAARRN